MKTSDLTWGDAGNLGGGFLVGERPGSCASAAAKSAQRERMINIFNRNKSEDCIHQGERNPRVWDMSEVYNPMYPTASHLISKGALSKKGF